MGKTVRLPSLLGTMTGTTLVGRISPEVKIALPARIYFMARGRLLHFCDDLQKLRRFRFNE
jgi:hypothetical protein